MRAFTNVDPRLPLRPNLDCLLRVCKNAKLIARPATSPAARTIIPPSGPSASAVYARSDAKTAMVEVLIHLKSAATAAMQ